MPEFIRSRKVKVRRLAQKGYMEVTIPKILQDNEIIQEGDKLTPVFDSVLVYLPEGKEIDLKKLKEAISEKTREERHDK